MSIRDSRGFTLIELLVVIFILGLLMALLLPAINSIRESGSRTQCLNNMREVGKAVQEWESAHNQYPGWRHYPFIRKGVDIGSTEADETTSWVTQILPGLGRRDVFDRWKNSSSSVTLLVPNLKPHIDVLVCTSDVAKISADEASISIVANCGRRDRLDLADGAKPADWRSNAVFLDLRDHDHANDEDKILVFKQTSSWIMKGDGLENTLMLSENLDATTWDASDSELDNGFNFWPLSELATDGSMRINGPGVEARPSSRHPGGVNVLYCSGAGKFIDQSISYRVFIAQMTPRGGEAQDPGTTTPSSSEIIGPLP